MSPARLARISYLDLEGSVLHPINGMGEIGNVRPGLFPLAQELYANPWKADVIGVGLAR